jgi:hypothetical protein
MVAILNPKWSPKYKNPRIWVKFGFQVDYDVEIWYPNFTGMLSTMSRCADYFQNFQNVRRCHGNPQKYEKIESARNWMKLNRNVVWHVYKWFWGLGISKCQFIVAHCRVT